MSNPSGRVFFDLMNSDLQSALSEVPKRTKPSRGELEKVLDETADQVRKDFEVFLANYQCQETNSNLYIEQIKLLPKTNSTTIYVDYSHLEQFSDILAEAISLQYFRMEAFIRKAVQNIVRIVEPSYLQISMDNAGSLREFSVSWYGLNSIKK